MSDTTEKLQNIEGNKCRATMYFIYYINNVTFNNVIVHVDA